MTPNCSFMNPIYQYTGKVSGLPVLPAGLKETPRIAERVEETRRGERTEEGERSEWGRRKIQRNRWKGQSRNIIRTRDTSVQPHL